jgi:hypothetical protein
MAEQGETGDLLSRPKEGFNVFYFLVTAYAWAFFPIIRCRFGRRAGGLPALVAMVGILWYAAQKHSNEMLIYFWVWVVMLVYRKLTSIKGVISEYQGWPYLTAWLTGNEMVARLLEAALMFVVGNYLYAVSEPLGHFVAFGSLALAFKLWAEWIYESRMDDAMEDAKILMEMRMERFKRR